VRAEIADLVHRYADAVSRRDMEQWDACWAPDARWEMRADRIASDADGRCALLQHAFDVLEGVVQLVMNGTVSEVSADEAEGRWYIVEHTRRTNGVTGLIVAHYDDRYVRMDGRWLFAARTLVRHYEGPPDLTGTFSR
jgi:ketosteroid isomerase-like protein